MYRKIGFVSFAFLLFSGCGSSPSDGLIPAKGTVSLDGTAISKGIIRFVPTDGVTPSVDAAIEAGKYETRLPKGKLTVLVNSGKKIGEQRIYETDPNSPMTEIMKEMVPEKYNVKTTLSIEVSDKPVESAFDLKTK